MKIRSGFVSNSSSSSFIVSLNDISAYALVTIMEYSNSSDIRLRDTWTISVDMDRGALDGYTSMDNDDLGDYLKKHNISTEKFTWDHY